MKCPLVNRPVLIGANEQEDSGEEVYQRREDPQGFDEDVNEAANNNLHSRWILAELKKCGRLRKCQITARTGWSDATVRRVLARLRDEGKVVFEGSARSGYWRVA